MMMRTLTALACAAATFGAVAAEPSGARAALASFHAALSSGDKDKALAQLSPQVAIYESGFVERSRDEYASHHLAGDIKFAKTTTHKVLRHDERVSGDSAVVWQETETTGSAGGKPVHLLGATTAVLEKIDDRWLIVHLHWSSRKAK